MIGIQVYDSELERKLIEMDMLSSSKNTGFAALSFYYVSAPWPPHGEFVWRQLTDDDETATLSILFI